MSRSSRPPALPCLPPGARFVPLLAAALAGCDKTAAAPIPACGEDALSTCLERTQPEAWYKDQGERYFDSLDASADVSSRPTYAELVARWEWPPWLLLTGYGRDLTEAVDAVVLVAIPDTTVPERDCRVFDEQPFTRCRVNFDYSGQACPIYEEFTFNDQGEITFVEAWSDQPGLVPMADPDDTWGEGDDVHRLSTRVPGLGNSTGQIDPTGEAMTTAAADDPEVADFAARTQDFWGYWNEAYAAQGEDVFAVGCGWEAGATP